MITLKRSGKVERRSERRTGRATGSAGRRTKLGACRRYDGTRPASGVRRVGSEGGKGRSAWCDGCDGVPTSAGRRRGRDADTDGARCAEGVEGRWRRLRLPEGMACACSVG